MGRSIESNGSPEPYEEVSPQQGGGCSQQAEDPVKLLQMRLAKGEITSEKYQASLKMVQSA
jgi:uncharacterized membrane protein